MPSTRTFVVLLLALLLPFIVAAASDGGVVVAAEDCVAGPDIEEGSSPDWEDLCTISWRTVASGEDVPTTVEVELAAVGDVEARVGQVMYQTEWSAGDCVVRLHHRDEAETGSGEDRLVALCGDVTVGCLATAPVVGGFSCTAEPSLEAEVEPPVIEGRTITWSLTFDGDLAPLAAHHEPGDVIDPGHARAGQEIHTELKAIHDGLPGTAGTLHPAQNPEVCFGAVCTSPLAERIDAHGTYTIG